MFPGNTFWLLSSREMIIPFWIPFHFFCFFLMCKCGQSLPGTSCSVRSPGLRGDLQLIPPLPRSQRWEQMYRGKNEQLIAENLIYNPKRTCADIKPRLQRTFLKNLFKSDPHMLKIFPSYQSSIEAPIKRWLSSQPCFSPATWVPRRRAISHLHTDYLWT